MCNRREPGPRPGVWATIPQVCAHLGLVRFAIAGAIRRGDLQAARIGRRILVHTDSLRRLLVARAIGDAIGDAAEKEA